MTPKDISVWIGIITAIGGGFAAFATSQQKVAELESKMSQIYSVDEIRGLESRLTALEVTQKNSDVSALSGKLATLTAEVQNVQREIARNRTKVEGISGTDTSKIEGDVRVNSSRMDSLEDSIQKLDRKIERAIEAIDDNPLG